MSDVGTPASLNADASIIVDFLMLVFVLSSTAATFGDMMLRLRCRVAEFVLLEDGDWMTNSSSGSASSLESRQMDDVIECVSVSLSEPLTSSCCSMSTADSTLEPDGGYPW